MKPPKRPWTRAEKLLLASPLLIVVASGGIWLWQRSQSKIFVTYPDLCFVSNTRFSPDGRRLVVIYCGGDPLTASGAVFDVESRTKICDLQTPKNFEFDQHLEWSPNGKQIVGGYGLGKVSIWNSQDGVLDKEWAYGGVPISIEVSSLSFSRDGTKIIGEEIPATIFDSITGTPLHRFKMRSGPSGYGNFSCDGKLIAIENLQGNKIEIRDVSSSHALKEWDFSKQRHKNWHWQVGDLQWNNDGVVMFQKLLNPDSPNGLTINSLPQLIFWDSREEKTLIAPNALNARKFSLCPASSLVAINSYGASEKEDGSISVWDYRQGKYTWKSSMRKIVRDFKWSFDGKYLAVLEEDDNNRLLQIFAKSGKVLLEQGLSAGLNSLDWSPDSKQLAIAQDDGIVIVDMDEQIGG